PALREGFVLRSKPGGSTPASSPAAQRCAGRTRNQANRLANSSLVPSRHVAFRKGIRANRSFSSARRRRELERIERQRPEASLLACSIGERPNSDDSLDFAAARFGRIDRSIRELTLRFNASLSACHHRIVDVYRSQLLRCRRTDARKAKL